MQLSQFDFDLPSELIAQHPRVKRDQSRLMIVNRQTQEITEITFKDLPDYLNTEDQLIFNDSKVFPARLFGKRETGGFVEILLAEKLEANIWKVLAKPGRKLKVGSTLSFSEGLNGTVIQDLESQKVIEFETNDFMKEVFKLGQIPLPPYIKREKPDPNDKMAYQTVYAKEVGSIAAPTAGLHFTEPLLEQLRNKNIDLNWVTLHVGLGTFSPIVSEDLSEHKMHREQFIISEKEAIALNQNRAGKSICVGTTTLRALESAANSEGEIQAGEHSTDLFIQPGYSFKYVKHLLTNFHLPKSSLFILICAFMGEKLAKKAYQEAVKRKFKFFSYGDAMLIL